MYRDIKIVPFSQISKLVFNKICPPLPTVHKNLVPYLAPCPFNFLAGTLVRHTDGQTTDKVIPKWHSASLSPQKVTGFSIVCYL